jgi:hypothetical protein
MVKFNDQWLSQKDSNSDTIGDWAEKVNCTVFKCRYCQGKEIKYAAKGRHALIDHAKTEKHIYASNTVKSTTQQRMRIVQAETTNQHTKPPAVSLQMYVIPDKSIVDEIIWVLNIIKKKSAFLSAENDSEALHIIAPNDLQKFSLDKNKVSCYVNMALGPYFKQMLIDDFADGFFTLLFDETRNNKQENELQITVKYWSKTSNKVLNVHARTYYLDKGNAETIFMHLESAMGELNLSYFNMVMLSSDGPNVNKAVMRMVKEKSLETRRFPLMDIGFCRCHNLHNSMKHGMKTDTATDSAASKLAYLLYEHFKDGDKWRALVKLVSRRLKKFKRHLTARWATLGPSSSIIIENWPELKMYCKHIMHHKKLTKDLQSILTLMKNETMLAELVYVEEICGLIEPVILYLERRDLVVFKLNDVFEDMYQKLLLKICKKKYILAIIQNQSFDIETDNDENIFLPSYAESEKLVAALKSENVNKTTRNEFKIKLLENTKKTINYLFNKDFLNEFYRCCSFLSVQKITSESSQFHILCLADLLKFPYNR